MRFSRKKMLSALVACGCIYSLNAGCDAEAAMVEGTMENNQAAKDLQRDARTIQANTQQDAQTVELKELEVDVNDVTFDAGNKLSEAQLRAFLPELKKSHVNVYRLSQEIQLANDNCGVKINTNFHPAANGTYDVKVTSLEKKTDFASITIANNGTGYDTGDWRATASYVKKNLTGNGDTLGVAYTTAPGHWSNVQQAALSYKWLMPSAHDTMTFGASYSKVDVGNVLSDNMPFGMTANGKGLALGLHYQHNLRYTAKDKDWWDFGFDYRKYDNDYELFGGGISHDLNAPDYDVKLLSATYVHSERQANQGLVWHAGITTNVGGIDNAYRAGNGSDSHFNILQAGLNYQYRTNEGWIVGVKANGQYTGSKLVSSERFGLGGQSSIRGFNERVIAADKGISGSLELMTPELFKNARAYVFTDMGAISSNTEGASSRNLASAGIGLRFSDPVNYWNIDLSYAKILQDFDEGTAPDNAYKRWNLMLTKTF